MRNDLQQKLYDDFPQLFQDKDKPMAETCMYWGCACGNGWFDILYDACKKIMETNPPKELRFFQVKEKFGGLTLYFEGEKDHYEKIREIVSNARTESHKTCEFCGSKENVSPTKHGWIRNLCQKCHNRKE